MNNSHPQKVLRRRSATLTGLVALSATLTTMAATSSIPTFWKGMMTGIWGTVTVGLIAFQVWLSRYRR